MFNVAKLIVISMVTPLVVFSQSIGGFDFQSVFNFVEEDMPEAFEVGQSVLFELEVEFSVAGFSDGALFSYPDAVS